MKNLKLFAILLIATVTTGKALAQTTQWNTKTAKQWLKESTWRNGATQNPHPATNLVEFARQYHADTALWNKVFIYLSQTDLDSIAPGKYPIYGDKAFASITEGPSKTLDQAGWESHRKYIDLQYVIRGKEQIGVVAIEKATVTKPYDETKDAANYTAEGKYYIASSGTFFLFFPADVHRPNIKVDGYEVVKKLVIKVKVN